MKVPHFVPEHQFGYSGVHVVKDAMRQAIVDAS
jgi:hypothetical protein